MSSADKKPSPKKRYFTRIKDLAAKDAQIGQLIPIETVRDAIVRPELSYADMIRTILEGYAGRPALAERDYAIESAANGAQLRKLLPRFSSISYGELHRRVQGLASIWRNDPRNPVRPGDFVCIFGFTSIDFVVADLACAYAEAVSVPLQTTLAGTDLSQIVADTDPAALVASIADLPPSARQR